MSSATRIGQRSGPARARELATDWRSQGAGSLGWSASGLASLVGAPGQAQRVQGGIPASVTIETDDIRKTYEQLKSRGVYRAGRAAGHGLW
jgi:hypothetical protein